MTSPAEQARVFMAMMLCGAGLGAAYDLLCLARRTVLRGGFAQALLDLGFGVLCAACVTAASVRLRVDAFRWYTMLGAAAGMGLYGASLGAFLRRLASLLVKICEKKSKVGGKMTK